MPPRTQAQATSTVLMIEPVAFGFNAETAATNRFQDAAAHLDAAQAQQRAQAEFQTLAAALRAEGVRVIVVADRADAPAPDALFPNNWISLHADGSVLLYPLLVPSRRREVRLDVVERLRAEGFRATRIVDLRAQGPQAEALEGTGSVVLDRAHAIAYAALSPRTHPAALARFARAVGYEILAFGAVDRQGVPIYHTNVLMCVGSHFAALCTEALPVADEREAVTARLTATGHEVIPLTYDQLEAFAGNMLEVRGADGAARIVLSARAQASLTAHQRARLEAHGRLVAVALPTIEALGGGSARCLLAEVFLPLAR